MRTAHDRGIRCANSSWNVRCAATGRHSPPLPAIALTAATRSPTACCETHIAPRTPSSRRCSARGATCRPSVIPRASTRGCSSLVVNACYTEARTERRWSAKVRVIPLEPPIEPDVARSVAARDELDHAFRRLTAEQRTVVVLHHHLGYPLTEIAATLGIPEGTARSRLHYAVRQLRATLDESPASLATSEERPA